MFHIPASESECRSRYKYVFIDQWATKEPSPTLIYDMGLLNSSTIVQQPGNLIHSWGICVRNRSSINCTHGQIKTSDSLLWWIKYICYKLYKFLNLLHFPTKYNQAEKAQNHSRCLNSDNFASGDLEIFNVSTPARSSERRNSLAIFMHI